MTATPSSAVTDTPLDELGPVDYLIVEFPAGASNFTGEMATELLALVDDTYRRLMNRQLTWSTRGPSV